MKKIRFILFLAAVVAVVGLSLYSYSLPESIAIKQGQSITLDFFLPLSGDVSGGDVQAIKANDKPVDDNIHFDLSKTVFVGEEQGSMNMRLSLFGLPIKNVSLNVLPETELVPVGETVGIVLETDGVLVLGTGSVKDKNGINREPCKGLIRSGDMIKSVNGITVNTKEELTAAIRQTPETTVIKTDRTDRPIEIKPVISQDGVPMIGLWVRDSTQGIGTITYYNAQDKTFGALGHPVTDIDTGGIIKIRGGAIYCADIRGVVKGEKGKAGELSGAGVGGVIGTAENNCVSGIYGRLNNTGSSLLAGDAMPIALKDSVKCGSAYILADVDGKGPKKYTIEIESINVFGKNTSKGMVIRMTDKTLIQKTGGIVQGMSGCPIIQNGCLVGAVTHVFVRDPTRGYGIFIENMLCG